MNISQIDKNFDKLGTAEFDDKDLYQIPSSKFDLYGVYYDQEEGRFRRVPTAVSKTVSDGVDWLSHCTAGGRLRFTTDATEIALLIEYTSGYVSSNNQSGIGVNGLVLIKDNDDNSHSLQLVTLIPFEGEVAKASCQLPKGEKNYTLYFPTYNGIKKLIIGVNKGAKVQNGLKYKDIKPILYYGSSITQGACASRADQNYPAVICKWNNVDYINLGFSGNAKGEDEIIEYVCSQDCSLFVCDYDHNQWDMELYKSSHLKLYKRFRETHPDIPILFLSAPDFDRAPEIMKEKIKIIRKHYLDAKKAGDNNVYFYEGRNFYGRKDRELCSIDGCHPNTLGMYYMAKKVYKMMTKISEQFK